jgi:hypothetical protein
LKLILKGYLKAIEQPSNNLGPARDRLSIGQRVAIDRYVIGI